MGKEEGFSLSSRATRTQQQYKAMMARIEPLLRMACAFCGAPIGQPCQSKNGRKLYSIGSIHDARLSRRPVARYRRFKS
jgi:hypothetical protein